jgi:transcriptional regulator with XRE-family HTH domain
VALQRVLAERNLSYRRLAVMTREADPDGRGIGRAQLSALGRGEEYPNMRTFEVIARALDISPSYFVEWRLAKAREELDERVVGFKAAVAYLERLERRAGRRRGR